MLRRASLRILVLALLGTTCTVGLVAHDLRDSDHLSNLLLAGEDGPSVAAVVADIPDADLAPGRGHDGQQFYAIARAPMHLDEASEHLDRPRYRLQRPLLPVLAWALHPSGGGTGLVVALLAVGVAGVLLSGVAGGALSRALGGGTWPALLVPVLPGAFGALRITAADTLALGLLLASLWAVETRRSRLGATAAIAAVLAKESMALLLVAHAVTRRTRESVVAAAGGVAVAGGWWVALRFLVDSDVVQVKELTWPFGGMVVYVDEWLDGRNGIGAAMALGSFALAFVALWRRGPRHPLFGALAAMTGLASLFAASVVALDFNAIRTLGPLLVLAILTLATPTPTSARPSYWAAAHASEACGAAQNEQVEETGRVSAR